MLENHWNTIKTYLFGQTTKQPLSNTLSPKNFENTSNPEVLALTLLLI